ncbi:MAG: hypothetical protein ACYCST_13320 [Acidimicrobiales bacterium]
MEASHGTGIEIAIEEATGTPPDLLPAIPADPGAVAPINARIARAPVHLGARTARCGVASLEVAADTATATATPRVVRTRRVRGPRVAGNATDRGFLPEGAWQGVVRGAMTIRKVALDGQVDRLHCLPAGT